MIVQTIARLLDDLPALTDPRQMPPIVDRLREALSAHAPVTDISVGPAWRFPETLPAFGNATAIGPANVVSLRQHFPYTAEHLAQEEPCFAVIADGVAVSVCRSVRISPHADEAGVETVEAFRGRGYAVQVAAAWANAVREQRRSPLYSTSSDNLASRAVARKLGLVQYGVDVSLH